MYFATEIPAPLRTLTAPWPYVANAQSVTMFILYALKKKVDMFLKIMEMHIFSRKKERIRFNFISLLTSIKSQSSRATDHCIHARVCRIDKKMQ